MRASQITLGACLIALVAARAAPTQRRPSGESNPLVSAEQGNGLYSLPRFQDEIAALDEAATEIKSKRFENAVPQLQALLMRRSTGVINQPGGLDLFTGLRQTVIDMIRNLPGAGMQAYENLVRRQAAHLPQQPAEIEDRGLLAQWAWNFPCSRPGLEARIRLGDLALIEGDGIAAQQHFRAAYDAMPATSSLADSLVRRRAAADFLVQYSHGLPMPDHTASHATELAGSVLPGNSSYWPAYGGTQGTRPMSDPAGKNLPISEVEVHSINFDLNQFAMHLTGDMSAVYVNDGVSVWALNMLKPGHSEILWRAAGPMLQARQELSKTRNGINFSMVLAAAISPDVVVAALQVPHNLVGAGDNQRFRGGVEIIKKLPVRRLFAFDRNTGKQIWAHWDHRQGPISEAFDGHEAACSPLIFGDTVYVPSHQQTGAITYYLTAYDLYSGETKWRRLICTSQQEVNMFGNTNMEFAASPLAISGGIIYGTTNLGVCFAANAESGEIRWIRGYEVIPLPRTRLRGQRQRPVYFANNPAVVSNGVMVCTPLDSQYVLGLDQATGRLLWRQNWRQGEIELRWLLGILDGEFILTGRGILAIKPRSGNARLTPKTRVIATPETLGENSSDAGYAEGIPRGALSADRIYFLGSTRLLSVLDSRGNRDPRMKDLQITGREGNLLLQDGMMLLINNGTVRSYGDVTEMRRLAERKLRRGARNPTTFLKLAALLRTSPFSDTDELLQNRAEALYEQGIALARELGLGNHTPVYKQLANGLFNLALEQANRLRRVNTERALALYYKARKRAPLPHQWLQAQVEILNLTEDSTAAHLQELDLMASRFGHLTHEFQGFGHMPVAAYSLWQGIPVAQSAEQAAQRCQALIERFANTRLGDQYAGNAAAKVLTDMIDAAGRGIYAKIEQRAKIALDRAKSNPGMLQALVKRFPHSEAAEQATAILLDIAVLAGDLHAASLSFAQAAQRGSPGAGVMRRMLATAKSKGNHALAQAFAERLLAQHAEEISDFANDEGKTYAEIAQAAANIPDAAIAVYDLPVKERTHIPPPNLETTIHFQPAEVVPGFHTKQVPLFLSANDETLFAFDITNLPQSFADARYDLPMDTFGDASILICGDVAVIIEEDRVRGIAIENGRTLWIHPAPKERALTSLGIQSGVLHLFSRLHSNGDGGILLGLEPLTGAALFVLTFPVMRRSTSPIAAAGYLWTLAYDDAEAPPAIVKLDPLHGHVLSRATIPPQALNFLGYADGFSRRRRVEFERSMFCDSRAIYLPIMDGVDKAPPKLLALGLSGKVLWHWTGRHDRHLAYAGVRNEEVVLLERGNSSRLIVLDRHGQTLHSTDLGANARVTNGSSNSPRKSPAPDVLLITSIRNEQSGASLTCWSLEPHGPRFREQFRAGVQRIRNSPQLGESFIAIPILAENNRRPQIRVLDLKTRRGALPKGKSSPEMRKLFSPMTIFKQGTFTVVDTPRGITILGK